MDFYQQMFKQYGIDIKNVNPPTQDDLVRAKYAFEDALFDEIKKTMQFVQSNRSNTEISLRITKTFNDFEVAKLNDFVKFFSNVLSMNTQDFWNMLDREEEKIIKQSHNFFKNGEATTKFAGEGIDKSFGMLQDFGKSVVEGYAHLKAQNLHINYLAARATVGKVFSHDYKALKTFALQEQIESDSSKSKDL